MNAIMNHELVHVVTMDQAAGHDRFFRRLFGGKVMPLAEQPESVLYFYLTTPRVAAPRWFHEGSAVFVDTWMAGGIGRAQGGLRRDGLPRDGARQRAVLRPARAGVRRHEDRLPAPDQLVSLRHAVPHVAGAHATRPSRCWTGWRASRAAAATTPRSSATSSAGRWKARGPTGSAAEKAFQTEEPRGDPPVPDHAASRPHRRARWARCRAPTTTRRRDRIYAAFNYPGVVAHVGALDVKTGEVERIVRFKGPMIYTVASLAYDQRDGILYYTTDNGAYRDLVRLDPQTGKTTLLQKDARIGELAFNKADRSLWGIRHLNGLCTIVRMEAPYTEWTRVVTFPYGTVVYDLDVSPDGTKVVAAFGEIDGKMDVRVFAAETLLKGDDHGGQALRFRPVGAVELRLLARRTLRLRHVVPHRRLQRVPLRARHGRDRSGEQHRDGVLPAHSRWATTSSSCSASPGRDWCPRASPARRSRTPRPSRFLASGWRRKSRWCGRGSPASPAEIPWETLPKKDGVYKLAGGLKSESFYPDRPGLQGLGGRRACDGICPIGCSSIG